MATSTRPRVRLAGHAALWALVAAAAIAGAIAFVAATGMRPGFDAFGWMVWGHQVLYGSLNTSGAPSWKPLTFLFTLPYALFGHTQVWLWSVTSVAGTIAAGVFAARVAYRLTGPGAAQPPVRAVRRRRVRRRRGDGHPDLAASGADRQLRPTGRGAAAGGDRRASGRPPAVGVRGDRAGFAGPPGVVGVRRVLRRVVVLDRSAGAGRGAAGAAVDPGGVVRRPRADLEELVQRRRSGAQRRHRDPWLEDRRRPAALAQPVRAADAAGVPGGGGGRVLAA